LLVKFISCQVKYIPKKHDICTESDPEYTYSMKQKAQSLKYGTSKIALSRLKPQA